MSNTTELSTIKFTQSEWTKPLELRNSSEFIQKISQAAARGFFYLEIPSDLKPLISHGTAFANSFYKTPEIINIPRSKEDYTAFIISISLCIKK